MTDEQDHNKIIAAKAREVLAPIGMVRKGRSRTWLADRAWWLGIVEFQPSAWSRGTYLNVSLMWLWQPIGYLTFEVEPRRVGQFVDIDATPDVGAAVTQVVNDARDAMTSLFGRFDRLSLVIDYFRSFAHARRARDEAHLATAYGLTGDMVHAREAFDRALVLREDSPSNEWRALSYLLEARPAAEDEALFRAWATATVSQTRASLKLSSLTRSLPDQA
jgi:hypothetical protein